MDLALAFEDSHPFKLTVDQYQGLIEQGVIEEGANVELLEGMIVQMNSQATVHMLVTFELAVRFRERLKDMHSELKAFATPTVAISEHNALDPDVAIMQPPKIGPNFVPVADVRLLVEVSRTTLRKDLGIKRDIYAKAGVPEYWVVDVKKAMVHRFWNVCDGIYRLEEPVPLAGPLGSLTIPDLIVDGAGIL